MRSSAIFDGVQMQWKFPPGTYAIHQGSLHELGEARSMWLIVSYIPKPEIKTLAWDCELCNYVERIAYEKSWNVVLISSKGMKCTDWHVLTSCDTLDEWIERCS